MAKSPTILAMDLEGVLVPEIWIAVAEKTGIERLRLTTRDIPDYDKLMKGRLLILKEKGIALSDIQKVIRQIEPIPGALKFLKWARSVLQIIILSDTYYEFAMPLMEKLFYPTLFCNSLETDGAGMIVNYCIRKSDGKKRAVEAFRELGFRVAAIGDSYNDTTMLNIADLGLLFRPPANVVEEFPQFPVFNNYDEMKDYLEKNLIHG